MLYQRQPMLLYPKSRQYPFDEVCGQIVQELEKRNWKVPGIEVKFDVYGTGEEKYVQVDYVIGNNFMLYFGRVQGRLGDGYLNNMAAINRLSIPKKELHVYDDESGPTYYVYVGDNWTRDAEWFRNSGKVHAKLSNEPRRFLEYEGTFDVKHRYTFSRMRPPYLAHTDDLGRQYGLASGDPAYYKTNVVMQEFADWLKEKVLWEIQKYPEQEIIPWQPPELIPFPSEMFSTNRLGWRSKSQIYTYVDYGDMERIRQGQKNPGKLLMKDRYALGGGGYRLLSLGVRNDGTVPKIAYDGFLWCGIGDVNPKNLGDLPDYIGKFYRWDRSSFVVRISPKFSNDIYVADMAPAEEYKEGIWKANPKQDRLTEEQYQEYQRIPGRTLVPIQDYKGGYKNPVVLINRELEFGEVELVGEIKSKR